MELQGKVAIVTGGGGGIGKSICCVLAREGAKVVVSDLDEKSAAHVAGGIVASGGEAISTRVNVASAAEVAAMVKAAIDQYGTIDILVNNAGVGGGQFVKDISEETWDMVMAVNLKGVFLCCKAVSAVMTEKGGGKIVNVASIAASRMGYRTGADYTASKAGVVGFSRHLAYELGIHKINVNILCPGLTLTPAVERLSTKEALEREVRNLPLGQWTTPEDQAEAVLFLVSERSSKITGHMLDVDSGGLLGWGNYLEDMDRRAKAGQPGH